MKVQKKNIALMMLLALTIYGCGGTDNSSQSGESDSSLSSSTVVNSSDSIVTSDSSGAGNTSTSSNTPDTSSSASSSEEEKNAVVVYSAANAVVSTNVTEAAPGEIVTITFSPSSADYTLDHIEINGTTLEGTFNGTATFVMPNTSALITVVMRLINKDGIIITGDVSARLVQEGDLYVARNVRIESESYVTYSVDGSELSCTLLDTSKCFAYLSLASQRTGFTVAGNAVYDFYYNPKNAAHPCYVVRNEIINYPSSATDIASLFAGSQIMSESCVNPHGVNHVEYSSTVSNTSYTWDLYSNNSSLGIVKDLSSQNEMGIVYKAQKGNVYEVVDNYIEGPYDTTKSEDTSPFSGKYDIVGSTTSGHTRYQATQEFVDVDSVSYSHDPHSLDFDLMYAYRTGFQDMMAEDNIIESDIVVTSEAVGTNGDFKVSVDSWTRWANSSHYQTTQGLLNAYKVYDLDITFNKAGSIIDGRYTGTTYNETYYDFTNNVFRPGYENVKPNKELTFAYGYGDAKEGQPTVDVSQYFTQSISNITVKAKDGTDKLAVTESLNDALSFTVSPSTALDAWQYGVVSSSNSSVIGIARPSYPYDFSGIAAGTATVRIDNHTENANSVYATHDVEVASAPYLRYVFLNTGYGCNDYDETFNATGGVVVTGRKYELQMSGSSLTGGAYVNSGLQLVITYNSGEGVIDIKYDEISGMLVVDATKASVTETTRVSIVISSPLVSGDRTCDLTFTVVPGSNAPESVVGTWNYEDSSFKDYVEFTTTNSSSYTYDYVGYIYYFDDNNVLSTFTFGYTYDAASGSLKGAITAIESATYSYGTSNYYLNFTIESESSIGVFLAFDNDDEYGYIYGDGTYEYDPEYGSEFTPSSWGFFTK